MSSTAYISEVFQRVVQNQITSDELVLLTPKTKCRLIHQVVEQLNQDTSIIEDSVAKDGLRRLAKSFQVSQGYYDWWDSRKTIYASHLRQRKNKHLLTAVRDWQKTSKSSRQETLRDLTRLQRKSFCEGSFSPAPISHNFKEWRSMLRPSGRTTLYGTFRGSLNWGTGRITQNISDDSGFDLSGNAVDTAHHEMAHGVHFLIAHEYHRGRIRKNHVLHDEAQYFHAVEVRNAVVPPVIFSAYQAQTSEYLAESEGTSLSKVVHRLAHN